MRFSFISAISLMILTWMGCAAEKRLGESRVQTRRYSTGFHVQHHKEPKTTLGKSTAEASRSGNCDADLSQISNALSASLEALHPESAAAWSGKERRGMDDNVPCSDFSWAGAEVAGRERTKREIENQAASHPVMVSLGPEVEALPAPIAGRHPDAVPGFILSLGWVFGLIGSIALDYLAATSIVGFAFALGVILSIAGYSLSRRAFRMSKANPDRYPRSGLASAGRWVGGAIGIAAMLWLAIILLVLLTW